MVLQHCQPQKVGMGPAQVDVSSTQGPGTVDVTGPGGMPIYGSVPVPGSGPVPVPDAVEIHVHYRKDEEGPDHIDADVHVSSV
jgi:hypothetical protein